MADLKNLTESIVKGNRAEATRLTQEAIDALDGAVVCDRAGKLLSYGAVLLLPKKSGIARIEGSRSRAAHSASFYGLSIKISSDGGIDVIESGESCCLCERYSEISFDPGMRIPYFRCTNQTHTHTDTCALRLWQFNLTSDREGIDALATQLGQRVTQPIAEPNRPAGRNGGHGHELECFAPAHPGNRV